MRNRGPFLITGLDIRVLATIYLDFGHGRRPVFAVLLFRNEQPQLAAGHAAEIVQFQIMSHPIRFGLERYPLLRLWIQLLQLKFLDP
ncbi:hypothetical protein D3C73_1434410 [compost metagenome]